MLKEGPAVRRTAVTKELTADLVVVGGGMAGCCCAITAARAGAKVVLIQDRPVLGGNASSEVRLWVLGATAHMWGSNRWAREGGVIDEILVENFFRNPEGNALVFDTVLLEKVVSEPNVTLLLNTAVHDLEKSGPDTIAAVRAFCSQNSTAYVARAPLFCDASGDGIAGFLAGAAFRMGAEAMAEFGEKFAPSREYGELLGHSLYFYSKDTGKPVAFTPPRWALSDITKVPRYRDFKAREDGCRLWWIEWGGRLDTVHETETIKWELWKVVYGVWNYIKNSGKFPEAATLTLEWVGTIPGKRESRRFEGPLLLTQQDVIEQRPHPDDVAFGGWSIDLHPADGVYSEKPGCEQWEPKGVYGIPYRCLYSRNIDNLFLAGRIISATHVAFGSTRVMATCAHGGQAVGLAAATCARAGLKPADLVAPERMRALQRDLLRTGQHIPGVALDDPDDLVRTATLEASSALTLRGFPADGPWVPLDRPRAQLLPVAAGKAPRAVFAVRAKQPAELRVELRTSSKPDNHTPDVELASRVVRLPAGESPVAFDFDVAVDGPRYLACVFREHPDVELRASESRVTGVVSLARHAVQEPKHDIGVETFELWSPERRPWGRNYACTIEPGLTGFAPAAVRNGIMRPTRTVNAWVAAPEDPAPRLTLRWDRPVTIGRIELFFDTDADHPMESVLMGHPERAIPFCVKRYRVTDGGGSVLGGADDNHQTRNTLRLPAPVTTDRLAIALLESWGPVPTALFEVQVYPA